MLRCSEELSVLDVKAEEERRLARKNFFVAVAILLGRSLTVVRLVQSPKKISKQPTIICDIFVVF